MKNLKGAGRVVALMMLAGLLVTVPAWAGEVHEAAREGDLAKVKALVGKDPKSANGRDEFGMSPLDYACASSHPAVVEYLLEAGADPAAKSETGMTALHWAAIGDNRDLAALLVAKGADVNARAKYVSEMEGIESDRTTPLLLAAMYGQSAVAELLIQKGADVNAADGSGQTALHKAVLDYFSAAPAELLLAKGADAKAKDGNGRTPLHELENAGLCYKLKDQLIAKGADIGAKDNEGRAPALDGVNCKPPRAYSIRAVKARLFDPQFGDFAPEDLINNPEANLFNVFSDAMLVVVEVKGPDRESSWDPDRKLVITAVSGGKTIAERTLGLPALDPGGRHFLPLVVLDVGCTPIKIEARITSQKTKAAVTKDLEFFCGE